MHIQLVNPYTNNHNHSKKNQNRQQTTATRFLAGLRFVLFVVIQIEHIVHKIVAHTDTPVIGYWIYTVYHNRCPIKMPTKYKIGRIVLIWKYIL